MTDYQISDGEGSYEWISAGSRAEASTQATDWAKDGDWGSEGHTLDVSIVEVDEDEEPVGEEWSITVEIDPEHESLIEDATDQDETCGTSPDDHRWTADGEGGCDENPGVWDTGGTSMTFLSHCRRCGLHRTEYSTGTQRNPGEHDTVEYFVLTDSEIAKHRENGTMDADDQDAETDF